MRFSASIVVCASVLLVAAGAYAATFEELAAKAASARDANNLSQAIDLYRQAVELKPDWAEGWWFVGTLAYDSDRYDIGREAFSEFVKYQANVPGAWAFLGLCEFETADYTDALEHIRRGLQGPGLEPAIEQVLRFHEAMALTRLGLFDQAMPRYMPFVRRGIHDPNLIASIGLTALREPQLPKEIAADQRDVAIAAGETTYLWMAGDTTKTGPAFQKLVETYPRTPGVHYLYATYLLSFRPAEEAVEELKHELEVNPRNADARAMVALLMFRAGATVTAMPLAQRAAADGPMSPMAQYTYGLILLGVPDLKEAIERLESAERLDPANIEYHMALAGAYSKAGRHEDARRERRTSLTMAKESDSRGQE
ncbi:MAG TPA: tetratricopeptide repeat protein [Bradyrhizobium sp.]|nr:tetratricopeptide repeat protein [Bradyrhizobium sp.]